jgi:hypothetical protein
MRSKAFLSLLILISASGLAPVAQAQEFTAEQLGHDKDGHTFRSKVYMSHGKVRIEPASDKSIGLLDLDAGTSIILDTDRKTYIEQPPGMARQNVASFRTADNTPCVKNLNGTGTGTCKQVGTEMINGRKAEKWEIVQTIAGQTVTAHLWLDSQWHLRLKQEALGMTGELLNIKEGPQPASLFEIPADYHKMTMQDRFRNNSRQ